MQSRCKPCQAEIFRDRYKQDPEAIKSAVKKSAQKHRHKVLERNARYRAENPKKIFEWKKLDRERNKARVLADNANRRALMRGELTPAVKQMYALRDFYKAMSLGDIFHVDHIIPLARGGEHNAKNLQVIPAIDNLRKGVSL